MSSHTVIIGDGPFGEALAREFADGDVPAVLLADEEGAVSSARSAGIDAMRADPTEPSILDSPEVTEARTAIVAARDDGRSLLVTQLLRVRDTGRVVALVHDPRNIDAFAEAGVDAVCATTALAAALMTRHDEGSASVRSGNRTKAGESGESPARGRDRTGDGEATGKGAIGEETTRGGTTGKGTGADGDRTDEGWVDDESTDEERTDDERLRSDGGHARGA